MKASIITDGLPVAAGFVAASMLSKVPFVQQNPILTAAAPLAGALAVSSFMGKKGGALATGMVVAGVVNGVRTLAPSVAPVVGLAGTPYRSTLLPGVAGQNNYPGVVVE